MPYSPFSDNSSSNKFPLGITYSSRIQSNFGKNYVLVGFKPGFPLQAGELNEMMEQTAVQNTLMYEMMGNWAKPPAGVTFSALLPDWDGAVPVSPKNWTVSGTTPKNYTLGSGWLYIKKEEFLGGLGVWVWKEGSTVFSITGTSSPSVYYGFNIEYKEITATDDPTLKDNSGRTIFTGSSEYGNGADRIAITITSASSGTLSTPNFMPVLEHRGTKVYHPGTNREITGS